MSDSLTPKARCLGAEAIVPLEGAVGLTKREWMAGLALQGFLAGGGAEISPDGAASDVLEYVDALLSALAESGVE